MRNLHASVFLLILLLWTCKESPAPSNQTLSAEAAIREIAQTEILIHELEGLYFNHTYQLYLKDENGRIESHRPEYNHFAGIGDCATLNINTSQNILEIDFGEGCEDSFGNWRSGKLVIDYTYADDRTGNQTNIKLEDYSFQHLLVDGQISIERLADNSTEEAKTYELNFTNISVTTEETNQTAFSGTRTMVLIDYENAVPRTATLNVIQAVSGTLSDGTNFSKDTSNSLIFYSTCWSEGTYFPSQGNEQYTIDDERFTVEPSGHCGYAFNATNTKEETFQIDLSRPISN